MKLSFKGFPDHEYRIDDRRIPSTTGVIRVAGLSTDYNFDKIHSFRGTCVHFACAMIDRGSEPEITLSGKYADDSEYIQVLRDIKNGYLPAYRSFRARTGFQGHIYELGMIHPALRFGGTLDTVGECEGEIWLLDLKTGNLPSLVPVQLASYEMLIRDGLPINPEHPGLGWLQEVVKSGRKIFRKAVRLEKDGTDTIFSATSKGTSYDDRSWNTAWSSAMNLYNLRNSYGYL